MGFDQLAPHYDWMEVVVAGGLLQRMRLAWLPELAGARVLLAGEGHGRFLVPLSRHLPDARITCLDASARMLEVARRRLERENPGAIGRVEWVHASLLDWSPSSSGFDLVVTNFFLDCFDGDLLNRVVESISKVADTNSQWLVSDFALPARPIPNVAASSALWIMYRFFRATTALPARALDSPFRLLEDQGFRRTRSRESLFGFLTSQLWQRGKADEFYKG